MRNILEPQAWRPRRALVTGSGDPAGIGAAIAEALGHNGVEVMLHGRHAADCIRVREKINNARVHQYVAGDLTHVLGLGDVIDAARDWEIDILINNAALLDSGGHPVLTTGWSEFVRFMDANVKPALLLTQSVLPDMMKRDNHGRVIHISTEAAWMPKEKQQAWPYVVSKAALEPLSRGFAENAAGTSVTSNVALVGPTWSGRVEQLASQSELTPMEAFWRAYPQSLLGRFATPAEVAAGIVHLASPASILTNGTVVRFDGGVIPTTR
jgi:NAD(P)-dependent dehydrogenase (short-subunit alcohol dehydrogenase family)